MADGQIVGKDVINDDVFERLQRFVASLDDIILRFDKVEKSGRNASSSIAFADAEKQNAEAIRKSNTALTERERLERRIAKQTEKLRLANSDIGKAYAQQRAELLRLNRENRTQAIIANKNERAYTRLSRQYNEAKKELKDLIVTTGQYSPAAQRQAREVERLGEKIKTADNAAGDFQRNVGNYPSALRPAIGIVRQLIGVFGVVEGIRFGVRLARDLSRIAREAKGVEFAFKNIGSTGQESFEAIRKQTRGLFSDLEIKQAIVEFDNFRLSGEQLGTIFEFIAVRSAQTGKSFEFLRNSAIEAITKESILRADNLGISQAALNEELDKGVDFLTAFGNVAEREIGRAGNILDEAGNGGQRFAASLDNIKLAVGQNINTFKGFGIVNTFLERTNALVKIQGEFLEGNISFVDRLKASFGLLSASRAAENQKLLEEIENRKKLNEELEAQARAYERVQGFIGPRSEGNEQEPTGTVNFLSGPAGRSLNDINKELEEYNEKLQKVNINDKAAVKFIADKINALEAERKAILDLISPTEKATKTQEKFIETFAVDSEASFEQAISYFKNLRSEVEVGSQEYQQFTKDIENLQKAMGGLKGLDVSDINFIDEDSAQDAIDIDNFLNTEGIEFQAKLLAERLGQNQADLIREFDSLYERDFQNFQEYAEKKLEAENIITQQRVQNQLDFLSTTQDFAQAFFDIQSNRIEDEIEKQNKAFDNIVNSKNASEEQIRIAEIKRAENEKRLEKEREKRQRRAFLIQQAIEVGKVLIQRATASAAALAPPPVGLGPVFGAALLPGININAGLAIAAILAQSIPQFFKGKNYTDKYEGPATWGERGREVKIDRNGNVELSPNRTTPLYVKKDDIITPSVGAFDKAMQNPSSEIFKRVVGNKYANDTQNRLQVVHVKGESNEQTARLLRQTNRLLRQQNRRAINVTSKVVIKEPSKFFAA